LSIEIWKEMWMILAVFVVIWTALSIYMRKSKSFQKWEAWE
jgi:hypothetical protein